MRVVETGCRCWALVRVVETAGAGAAGAGRCDLPARVRVETGCRCWALAVRGGDRVPVLVLGAGCRELACRRSVLVPASDSEVKTTAASDSEG